MNTHAHTHTHSLSLSLSLSHTQIRMQAHYVNLAPPASIRIRRELPCVCSALDKPPLPSPVLLLRPARATRQPLSLLLFHASLSLSLF